MEKKIFALLFLGMILLSVSSVSALELNPFADKKIYEPILKEDTHDFIKQDFNSKYGVIKLSKTLFWIETDKIAEYSLINNTEQCLINCEARGKAVLYNSGQLFDDLRFIGLKGNEKELNAKYLIKEIETYEVEVPNEKKEVCIDVIGNGTKGETTKSCYDEIISYKTESREREVWNEYKGQVLAPGDYEWKVIANKKPLESIDFIPKAYGKEFNEWAWWNGDWKYKKEIILTNTYSSDLTDYQIMLNVSFNSNMKTNFGDIRFVNSSENAELPYWIEEKTDSSSAIIWVKVDRIKANSNTSIFMYYGNSIATNQSNGDNTFVIFDDFNSYKDSIWDNTRGSPSYSSGIATFSISNGAELLRTDLAFNSNYSAISKIKFYTENPASGITQVMGFAEDSNYNPWYVENSLQTISFGKAYQMGKTFRTRAGGTANTNDWNDIIWGSFARYELNRYDNNATAIIDFNPSKVFSTTAQIPQGERKYWLGVESDGGDTPDMEVDWTAVFKKIKESPTILIGAEQRAEGVNINLDSPIDNYETTDTSIFFNATIIPRSANITNVTWKAGTQTDFQTLNTNESITLNWTKTFADGSYSWNVTACWIGVSEVESCTESETRTFTIDSVAPNLTLNAPLTNFTTLTLPINVTLNFTASDSNLGSCWFSSSMNSTNTTFTCNTTQTRAFNSSGAHSFTYYANDTFGGVSTGTAQFYIYYVQPSATATNPITEGGFSTNTLWVNMTNIKFFPTNAWLVWNGTNLGAGTLTNVSNDSVRFDKTFVVPSINGTLANWTWYYNISGNPNVTNWNVSGAQSYISINISECGAGTYQILNYTLYDQKTRVISPGTNASIETDLTLSSYANSSQTWTFHTTKTGTNNLLICLPSGALNNSEYQLDSIAKYSYQDHVVQYHYISNFRLNSSTIPQSIKLYDLATAESTSFLLNYQDENYLYVENAVIDVWRRYVGDGVFVSVEHGKTDAQGQTRLHLVTEDIIYKFLVWIDGELVYTSPEYLALCQATPCQINLKKSINDSDGFSERDNIVFDYAFDKTTRTATFDFSTKDGTETTINMTILSSNSYANETACTTTLTTSGGQVSCVIPTAFTNTTYQTIIYKDGEFFGTSFDSLAPSSMEIFGYTGIILTAIGYLFLALMGISSGIATIVFGIIGLALMGIVQIFESGSIFGLASAILWLVVAGVIIIIKITKRRIQ